MYFANCCFISCAEQTKSQKRCPKSNSRGTTLQQNKLSSSTSLLLVSPGLCSVQCCFTSTETIRLVRDGEPRTATSTVTRLLSFDVWCSVQCCFTSTETIRLIRDGEPRTATSTFTRLLSFEVWCSVQCCFTSTETIRIIRDGEPRTATSTFTRLLSFGCGVQFSVALRPQKPKARS